MHRIDTPTAQADKFGPGKNGFTGGNPQTGQLPTALDEDFFDSVQEEIARVVEGAGMSLEKSEKGQLFEALGKLFLKTGNNLSEIKAAGVEAVQEVLKNLGLGEAAKRMVGTGANQLPDMSNFSSGTNWFSLPSGHIVQFFSALINGADTNGTETPYPFRFPSQMIACSVLWSDSTTSSAPTFKIMGNLSSAGAARIKASASSGQYGILIIAVGK